MDTGGFIHPVMANVMTVISFILVVASVAVAAVAAHYAWRNTGGGSMEALEGRFARIKGEIERISSSRPEDDTARLKTDVETLRAEVNSLHDAIAELRQEMAAMAAPPAAPEQEEVVPAPAAPAAEPVPELPQESAPEEEEPSMQAVPPQPVEEDENAGFEDLLEQRPIWQDFIDDYHMMREGFSPERGEDLCWPFIDSYVLRLLVCTDHNAMENGKNMPKFEVVDDVNEATFWAYELPGAQGLFAVVPSPMFPYDQAMHEEEGMKETFAARYEPGKSHERLTVNMPALFSLTEGHWRIEQPGILELEDSRP